ncbi:MAG: tetratricopeptide repeat protein, partial [Polyangiaceae bacterium]
RPRTSSSPRARSPTPLSDLYSAARALAVLVAPFDFQGKYQRSLPPPDECAVFQANDALYRFLVKATRAKPEERFQSAAEMSEQLVGVLRGIVGESGELGRIESTLFEPDGDRTIESTKGAHPLDELPKLKVDRDDSAANIILAASALPDAERRLTLFERAKKTHASSLELTLRIIDELITLGLFDRARDGLEVLQASHPAEWRLAWYRGRALLAQGKTTDTLAVFEAIAEEFPGELAPKQALARTHETYALAAVGRAAALDRAIDYYDSVSKADSSFTSAALGLARCLDHKGERAAAADAYRRVPSTSNRFALSRMELARLLVRGAPTANDLLQASGALEAVEGIVEGIAAHELRATLLAVAATFAAASPAPLAADLKILGVPFTEVKLRLAAEAELRTCARYAESSDARIGFVDWANAVRPLTLT